MNNTIVRLLEIFFPTQIDIIPFEFAKKNGPKPIIINYMEDIYKIFQNNN